MFKLFYVFKFELNKQHCDVGEYLTNINELKESKINSLSYFIDLFNIFKLQLNKFNIK